MDQRKQEFCIGFVGEMPKLRMNELSNFFYYLRVTYAIAYEFLSNFEEERILRDPKLIEGKFREHLLGYRTQYTRSKYFLGDLGEVELLITKIRKESPFEIWVMGQITALVLAVIIAGGTVDLKNMKFTLNPLGDGLPN